jgi:hypothetical protein
MFWLIWIILMVLVPVGAGVHVWWQLHHASRHDVTPQPAQRAAQAALRSIDGTQTQ